MNQKELKELIEFLIEKDVAEFEMERGDIKVKVKRNLPNQVQYVTASAPQVAPPVAHFPPASTIGHVPAAQTSSAVPSAVAETALDSDEGLHVVKSPIVGTYYESPSPGAPPFIKVGDTVAQGQVLCIVEAMKLMNEIESDVSGEIVKMHVKNGQPVEYGQPLFAIRGR
jgi:acetyl-CoA carboxylase biotin carboxyl carrier protein